MTIGRSGAGVVAAMAVLALAGCASAQDDEVADTAAGSPTQVVTRPRGATSC